MSATNAELIFDVARRLTAAGDVPFSRIEVYRQLRKTHPDRERPSPDPTFQGMISGAAPQHVHQSVFLQAVRPHHKRIGVGIVLDARSSAGDPFKRALRQVFHSGVTAGQQKCAA